MAHKEQQEFCESVRQKHPHFFNNRDVVDVGSRDINGNSRYLFHKCRYIGIDLSAGPNVDLIGKAHEVLPVLGKKFDVAISCECLEHDHTWHLTLSAMYHSLRPGGLLLVTAAGEGRAPHGTHDAEPWCSPDTNNYYQNVTNEMIAAVLSPSLFKTYYISQDERNCDVQFFAIKN